VYANHAIYQTIIATPLGDLLAKASNEALVSLEFYDRKGEIFQNENEILSVTTKQLGEYFASSRKSFTLPLAPQGTHFWQLAWNILHSIPYATTLSYKQQATLIGNPKGYRAVANANTKNPIVIIIPCHRVINANGNIGGYSGGIKRKEFLLELEKQYHLSQQNQ